MKVDSFVEYQKKKIKDSSEAVEILVALAIGVFGMVISFSGFSAEDPVVYILGIIIMISSAGWITMKFLNAILEFKNNLKKKEK